MSVLRVFQRNGIYEKYKTNPKKKHDKHYETPTNVGEKWRIDVKFVPKECKAKTEDNKYYQYTILDECSRKRFLYFTNEHSMYETVKAIKKAIDFFVFKPKVLQSEITVFEFFVKSRRNKESSTARQYDNLLETFIKENGITHKFIKPRTPEHNGKVERSHRIDQEKFYQDFKFYDLDDLKTQGKTWNRTYNNKRRFILNFLSLNKEELASLERLRVLSKQQEDLNVPNQL